MTLDIIMTLNTHTYNDITQRPSTATHTPEPGDTQTCHCTGTHLEAWAQGGEHISWQDTPSLLTIWGRVEGPLRLAQVFVGASRPPCPQTRPSSSSGPQCRPWRIQGPRPPCPRTRHECPASPHSWAAWPRSALE